MIKPTFFFWPIVCLVLSIASFCPDVVAAGELKILSLEQALAIAAEQNRDIRKALEYIQWAQGKYVEERAAALPQLTITSSISREQDKSQEILGAIMAERNDRRAAEIGVTQPLFTWGQVSAAIRAAKGGLKSADEQLRQYRQSARRNVAATFHDVLLAKELHKLAIQNMEQKKKHLDEAKRKHIAGIATDYDVLAAEVAVENARPEVIRSDNIIRTTRERLRFLLAMEEEIDVSGSLDAAMLPHPSYEEALAVAKERRPEINDLKYRADMYGELIKVADALDKPRLDLKGAYGWRDLSTSEYSTDGPAWNVGVYLSFPIFDGLRTRGKVAQARSDFRKVKIEEAKQIDAVALEIRDAINAVREAEEIVKSLSGTVVQAERLLFMAEKGYEYGVKISLEVDDAILNLIQAKSNLSRARRDYIVAVTNLEWAMGVLGENKKK